MVGALSPSLFLIDHRGVLPGSSQLLPSDGTVVQGEGDGKGLFFSVVPLPPTFSSRRRSASHGNSDLSTSMHRPVLPSITVGLP